MNALASHPAVKRRIEASLIDWSASAMNWVGDHIRTGRKEISWQDHVRWWLEGRLEALFEWAFDGSQQEIEAVYRGEVPPLHMSERQYEELDRFDRSQIEAACCDCQWQGTLADTLEDQCPNCRKAVWIEAFEDGGAR